MHALTAEHISKSYPSADGTIPVLQDVGLEIQKGEMVAIMGPSGSGKTTLLHILAGIDAPEKGEVRIREEDITKLPDEEMSHFRRKHIGMIFQDFQLLDSLTVKENILLPLVLDKKDIETQKAAVSKVMDALGITAFADKGITEISGGQKQRAAICRALVNEPEIIFGDEPTGSLDRKMAGSVMHCLSDMNKQFGISALIVTHDAYAASFCSRVLLLQDGKIACEAKKQDGKKNFQAEILNMTACQAGGAPDDIF